MKKLRLTSALIATLVLSFLAPSQLVFAELSPADYIGQGIDHYGKDDAVCSSSLSGTLVGDSNTEKALNFMMQNGFTLAGASGVIGNWIQETGVRPNIIQGGKTASGDYKLVPGVGFGLAQWTSGGRQKSLTAFMDKNNLPITDLGGQLNFFIEELKTGYPSTYSKVVAATDPVQAAIDFHDGYEGSADSDSKVRDVRGGNAQKTFDQYKDKLTSTTGVSASSNCGNRNPAGSVVWYSQTDPKWSANEYAGGTIGVNGCGPTSMAIILATLVDKTITPDQVAAATTAHQSGQLTSWQPLINDVNSKWNLNISSTPVNFDQAVEFLQSGKGLIWVGGSGDVPFTKTGHMVALVGVTSDGKITVADPYGGHDGHENIANYDKSVISSQSSSFFEVPKS